MKRALVLSGGGARGSIQAGVVAGLVEDQNLDFEVLHGVSTGALNAAFLAQASTTGDSLANLAQRSRELGQMWRSFTGNSSIYTRRFGGYAGLALGANSLYDNAPLRRLIEQNLDVTALSASGRFFACGFVSLKSGGYAERTHQHARIAEGVIASASIPIAFPFVEARDANGELTDVLVDGGVRNLSPLGSVFHQEPDEIYLVLTSKLAPKNDVFPGSAEQFPANGATPDEIDTWKDNFFGTKVSGIDVLIRTTELLTDEIYLSDVREALLWNSAVKGIGAVKDQVDAGGVALDPGVVAQLDAILKRRHYADISVIAPHRWWDRRSEAEQAGEPENDSENFDPQLIEEFLVHGREVANDRDEWLVVP